MPVYKQATPTGFDEERPRVPLFLFLVLSLFVLTKASGATCQVLKQEEFKHHIELFNGMEDENWTNFISNVQSWAWLRENIPFFDCPDREVEEIYYFRWWSFRKHLVSTTDGFVITEFLVPMRHAGAFNTISCAAGHHLTEGRWLRDERYIDDYIRFWLRGNAGKPQPHFHHFSSWFAAAIWDSYLVTDNRARIVELLDDLAADYRVWEHERGLTNGLFWQHDVEDGMEESISGSRTARNIRPTINSYMYGNAQAIAAMARLAGKTALAREFEMKAARISKLTQEYLWSKEDDFFEVRRADGRLSRVREEVGFIPWCFHLPQAGYESTWKQLVEPQGFAAAYGITTAERRYPAFRSHGCCKCEWDGAVWPFATSQTLSALANVLRDYSQSFVSERDYFEALLTYARSQHFEGKPYVGEYLDETTGEWLKGKQERSRYYNHSTFADLIITGLVGLRPAEGEMTEVRPLLPANTWDWFCLDGVRYHGHDLTIVWDKKGDHYRKMKGLSVLVDGNTGAQRDDLGKLTVKVKKTAETR